MNWNINTEELREAVAKANQHGSATFTLNEEHDFLIKGPTTFDAEFKRIEHFANFFSRESGNDPDLPLMG